MAHNDENFGGSIAIDKDTIFKTSVIYNKLTLLLFQSENVEAIACATLSPSDCDGDLTCDDCDCRLESVAAVANNEQVVQVRDLNCFLHRQWQFDAVITETSMRF